MTYRSNVIVFILMSVSIIIILFALVKVGSLMFLFKLSCLFNIFGPIYIVHVLLRIDYPVESGKSLWLRVAKSKGSLTRL